MRARLGFEAEWYKHSLNNCVVEQCALIEAAATDVWCLPTPLNIHTVALKVLW